MLRAAAPPMCRAASGDPVNETRRTRGSETSAAPTSSPIPWTMLNTPGGNPASSTRSASTEAVTGDHSAGLRITVLPAARAGAHFQVESMNGAFHGVMTTAGPAGIRWMALAVPFELQVRPSYSAARSAYARKFRAPLGMTRSSRLSRSIAMSRHSRRASGTTLASMRSASRCMHAARSAMPAADQSANASAAALTARSAVSASPRAKSPSFSVQSSGERSSNVRGEEIRRPPM